jgi:hypothetical protein
MDETNNKPKKGHIIRVDKNLTENSLDWLKVFGQDTNLCFDILLYMSNNAQRDIFNFGKIDLGHFARIMQYQKNNLQYRAELPAQTELVNKNTFNSLERSKKFLTVFENAFYKLGVFNIPVTSLSFDKEKNEQILTTKFIQIIKEIQIHVNSEKPNSKIYYSYTTSEEFDYNLSRYFFFADLSLVKELRDKNLLLLYFYLKNIENGKHRQFVERDFEKLCMFAGIKINHENIKYTKKNLQTRKLDKLKDYINFDYEPINVSGKWKYGYNFTFNDNKDCIENADYKVIAQADTDLIDLKVLKYYKRKYKITKEVDEKAYKEWFFNKDMDHDKKLEIFYKAMSELYKITKENATTKYFKKAEQFFTKAK